jgi:hypothetical protein
MSEFVINCTLVNNNNKNRPQLNSAKKCSKLTALFEQTTLSYVQKHIIKARH